jgi:hypothetical protein
MSLTNLLLCLLLCILLILALVYLWISQNETTTFTTKPFYNPYNRYSNNPYFNPAIYSMPGTIGDPYMLYGSGYMPYESAVPAVDVLRTGNSNSRIPAYYKQYLEYNITPFTKRNTITI